MGTSFRWCRSWDSNKATTCLSVSLWLVIRSPHSRFFQMDLHDVLAEQRREWKMEIIGILDALVCLYTDHGRHDLVAGRNARLHGLEISGDRLPCHTEALRDYRRRPGWCVCGRSRSPNRSSGSFANYFLKSIAAITDEQQAVLDPPENKELQYHAKKQRSL